MFSYFLLRLSTLVSKIQRKLSDQNRLLCEGELTLAECKAALDGMPSGKSPGLDGLPAKFYQHFWPVLGTDFVEVVNSSYVSGRLSLSLG